MFAEAYDLLMSDVDYDKIYLWMKPYLKPSDLIIDAGCGSGYFLLELLKNNHQSIGIDLDSHMLSRAREKLQSEDLYAPLYEHDLRKSYHMKADVIVMLFDVVNYFKGTKTVFKHAFDALNHNGRLIIDLYQDDIISSYDQYEENESEPIHYHWKIHVKNHLITHELTIEHEKKMIRQYTYPLKHYVDELEHIGFDVTIDKGPDMRKHYLIAYKK